MEKGGRRQFGRVAAAKSLAGILTLPWFKLHCNWPISSPHASFLSNYDTIVIRPCL